MNRNALLSRLLIVAVIGGFIPFGAAIWWGFELFSHFRVQYVVLAILLSVVAIGCRRRLLGSLLVLTAALNSWSVWPYLPTGSQQQSGIEFDVLNVNVNSENFGHARIVDAIRAADSDLVAVVELTPALDEALLDLTDIYPFRFAAPADSDFGIGILSRYRLQMPKSFSTGPTIAIDSEIESPAGSLRFVAVHLVPPKGPSMAHARNSQLDELAEYVSQIEAPLLVCGDFNLSPYSPFFSRFSEDTGLTDTRRGRGVDRSWPSFLPFLGIPIDHCLYRGPIDVASVKRLNGIGSDHYPVQVTLVWQENE